MGDFNYYYENQDTFDVILSEESPCYIAFSPFPDRIGWWHPSLESYKYVGHTNKSKTDKPKDD